MTARQFILEINQEFDQVLAVFIEQIIDISEQALTQIVNRTPVDTGKAKSNWFVTIGAVGFEVSADLDRTGQVSIARGTQVIATYRATEGYPIISIHNSLPYINRLENGYSGQAPAGMVAVTAAEIEASLL